MCDEIGGGEMDPEQSSQWLASVLGVIPGHSADSELMTSLALGIDVAPADVVTALLALFGAADVSVDDSGRVRVKASSLVSGYALKSLGWFLQQGVPLVDDWQREGAQPGPYNNDRVLCGAQFLRILEERRLQVDPSAEPLRRLEVAKAIIKSVGPDGVHRYLVQFDDAARAFQLIGGRRRPGDSDLETCMHREISEELPPGWLQPQGGYRLSALGSPLSVRQLSRTVGVFTEYLIQFYLVSAEQASDQIVIGPHDRWITREELLAGRTDDGQELNEHLIGQLDAAIAGTLAALPCLLEATRVPVLTRSTRVRQWARRNSGELTAVGVLLGLIALVLPFFL